MTIELDAWLGRVDQAGEYLDGFLDDMPDDQIAELAAMKAPGDDIRLQFLIWRASIIKEVIDDFHKAEGAE